MKSKLFGIFLIFCFVAPVATTFAYLQFQKKQVKKEIKWKMIAGIDKKELVLLKFTKEEKKSELNWKHAKEFEFNGEMYDIVESSEIGDTTYYWVWWDYEETHLNKQLGELVSFALGQNPENQENQNRLNTFFKSLYFSETEIRNFVAFNDVKNKHHFGQKFFSSIADSPQVPPPQKN